MLRVYCFFILMTLVAAFWSINSSTWFNYSAIVSLLYLVSFLRLLSFFLRSAINYFSSTFSMINDFALS